MFPRLYLKPRMCTFAASAKARRCGGLACSGNCSGNRSGVLPEIVDLIVPFPLWGDGRIVLALSERWMKAVTCLWCARLPRIGTCLAQYIDVLSLLLSRALIPLFLSPLYEHPFRPLDHTVVVRIVVRFCHCISLDLIVTVQARED